MGGHSVRRGEVCQGFDEWQKDNTIGSTDFVAVFFVPMPQQTLKEKP
jgi:hypothetical protein